MADYWIGGASHLLFFDVYFYIVIVERILTDLKVFDLRT